jgi:hypothetical protein
MFGSAVAHGQRGMEQRFANIDADAQQIRHHFTPMWEYCPECARSFVVLMKNEHNSGGGNTNTQTMTLQKTGRLFHPARACTAHRQAAA